MEVWWWNSEEKEMEGFCFGFLGTVEYLPQSTPGCMRLLAAGDPYMFELSATDPPSPHKATKKRSVLIRPIKNQG